LRRDYWGNGFGTEAAQAIVDFGFDVLGLHRIWATASPENLGSIRVLEKIGMIQEGILRQNLLVRGNWRDSVLFSILEGDSK
jgi:ribosomal-protein-alanine N-acetyltransferase